MFLGTGAPGLERTGQAADPDRARELARGAGLAGRLVHFKEGWVPYAERGALAGGGRRRRLRAPRPAWRPASRPARASSTTSGRGCRSSHRPATRSATWSSARAARACRAARAIPRHSPRRAPSCWTRRAQRGARADRGGGALAALERGHAAAPRLVRPQQPAAPPGGQRRACAGRLLGQYLRTARGDGPPKGPRAARARPGGASGARLARRAQPIASACEHFGRTHRARETLRAARWRLDSLLRGSGSTASSWACWSRSPASR